MPEFNKNNPADYYTIDEFDYINQIDSAKKTQKIDDFLSSTGIIEETKKNKRLNAIVIEKLKADNATLSTHPRFIEESIHPKFRAGRIVTFHSSTNPIGPQNLVDNFVKLAFEAGEKDPKSNFSRTVYDLIKKGDRGRELYKTLKKIEISERSPKLEAFPFHFKFAQIAEKTDPDFHDKLAKALNLVDAKVDIIQKHLMGKSRHNAPAVFHAGSIGSAVERFSAYKQLDDLTDDDFFLHAYEIDRSAINPVMAMDEAKPMFTGELYEMREHVSRLLRTC